MIRLLTGLPGGVPPRRRTFAELDEVLAKFSHAVLGDDSDRNLINR